MKFKNKVHYFSTIYSYYGYDKRIVSSSVGNNMITSVERIGEHLETIRSTVFDRAKEVTEEPYSSKLSFFISIAVFDLITKQTRIISMEIDMVVVLSEFSSPENFLKNKDIIETLSYFEK